MEVYEKTMQRHSGLGTRPRINGIQAMIRGTCTEGATYLMLSRRVPSREAAILQRMSREKQNHGTCLKGIYTLTTGEYPVVEVAPMPMQPVEEILRSCYGNEMRILAEYERRIGDPEYGPVFLRLAQQEREHCRQLLELIGRLQKIQG